MYTEHKDNLEAVTEKEDESSDDKEEETGSDDDNEDNTESEDEDFCFSKPRNAMFYPRKSENATNLDTFGQPVHSGHFLKPKAVIDHIRDSRRTLSLHYNASKALVTKKRDLKWNSTVLFYPQGIANILSLYNVQKKYKVTYNSSGMTRFIVH